MYDDVSIGDLSDRLKDLESRMNAKDEAIIHMNQTQQELNKKLNTAEVIISRLSDFISEENSSSLNVRAALRVDIVSDIRREMNVHQNMGSLETKMLDITKQQLSINRQCNDLEAKYKPHLEKLQQLDKDQNQIRGLYVTLNEQFEKTLLELASFKQVVADCRTDKKQTDIYFSSVQQALAEKLDVPHMKQFYQQIERDFLPRAEFAGMNTMVELRVREQLKGLDFAQQIHVLQTEAFESAQRLESLVEQKTKKNMAEQMTAYAPRDELKLMIDSRCCDTEKRVNEKIIAQEKVIAKNAEEIAHSLDVIAELNADGKSIQSELRELQRTMMDRIQAFQREINFKIQDFSTHEQLHKLELQYQQDIQASNNKQLKIQTELQQTIKQSLQQAVDSVKKLCTDLSTSVIKRISDFDKRFDSAVNDFELSADKSKNFILDKYTRLTKLTEDGEQEMREMLKEFTLKFNCIPDRQSFMERQQMVEHMYNQFEQFKDDLEQYKNKILKMCQGQERIMEKQRERLQAINIELENQRDTIKDKSTNKDLELLRQFCTHNFDEKLNLLQKQLDTAKNSLKNELQVLQKDSHSAIQKLDEALLFKAQKQDIESVKQHCADVYLSKSQLLEFQVSYQNQIKHLEQLEMQVKERISDISSFKQIFLKEMHFSLNFQDSNNQKSGQLQEQQQQEQNLEKEFNRQSHSSNKPERQTKQSSSSQTKQHDYENPTGQSNATNNSFKFPWMFELMEKERIQLKIQNQLEKKANNSDLIMFFDQKANKKLVVQMMNMLEMLKKQLIYLTVSFNVYIKSSLQSKTDPLYNKAFDKELLLQQTEKLLSWISSVNCYSVDSEKKKSVSKQKLILNNNNNNSNYGNNESQYLSTQYNNQPFHNHHHNNPNQQSPIIVQRRFSQQQNDDNYQNNTLQNSLRQSPQQLRKQLNFQILDNNKLEKFTDTVINQYQGQVQKRIIQNQQQQLDSSCCNQRTSTNNNNLSIMQDYQDDFKLMDSYIKNISPKEYIGKHNLNLIGIAAQQRGVTSQTCYNSSVSGNNNNNANTLNVNSNQQQLNLSHIDEESERILQTGTASKTQTKKQFLLPPASSKADKMRPNTVSNSPANINHNNNKPLFIPKETAIPHNNNNTLTLLSAAKQQLQQQNNNNNNVNQNQQYYQSNEIRIDPTQERYKQTIQNMMILERQHRYNQAIQGGGRGQYSQYYDDNSAITKMELHQSLPKRTGKKNHFLNKTMEMGKTLTVGAKKQVYNENQLDKNKIKAEQDLYGNSILLGPFQQNEDDIMDKDSCMEAYLGQKYNSNNNRYTNSRVSSDQGNRDQQSSIQKTDNPQIIIVNSNN